MTLMGYVEGIDDVRELTDKTTGSSTGYIYLLRYYKTLLEMRFWHGILSQSAYGLEDGAIVPGAMFLVTEEEDILPMKKRSSGTGRRPGRPKKEDKEDGQDGAADGGADGGGSAGGFGRRSGGGSG